MPRPATRRWRGIRLLEYWLGELEPEAEARTEEHYLGCAECSGRLEQLAALAGEVRAVARTSGVNMVINDQFVRRLAESGLQVREYRLPLNGSVNCTVAPEDDVVVARLEAPLEGVKRVDMLYVDSDGRPEMRQEDIPFVADSGGVVFSPGIDAAARPAGNHPACAPARRRKQRRTNPWRIQVQPHAIHVLTGSSRTAAIRRKGRHPARFPPACDLHHISFAIQR